MTPRFCGFLGLCGGWAATVVPVPPVAGVVVAGPLLGGSLLAGTLVVVGGGGGALLVAVRLLGCGEAVLGGGLGGLLDLSGDGGTGAVLVGGGDDGPFGRPLDEGGGTDEDGGADEDGGTEEGGGADDSPVRPPDEPGCPADGGVLVGGVFAPEDDGGGGVVVGRAAPPEVFAPATLSITYCPNGSSVPAGGSVAVTFAPSGGTPGPAYPTASPAAISSRPARAKVVPARSGTVRRFFALKVLSFSPVVPTGRLMPRAGSRTSTSAIRSSFRGAGLTATTASRSYPAHFLLPSSNWTEIRPVSPSKGRSGFPHEHFTAGSPCSSTRIAIPAWSKELYGTAFSFL